jgi:alpha-tubulin suppressor-like RCC1 family protein
MNLGDGRLKLLGTGLAALWLTLGWQGAPADAITVTPANPTIGVGQTQQFTASGALTPTAVAGGGFHACMRLPDGTVQCWGENNYGQLGNGDGNLTNSSVPVAVRNLNTATRVVTGDGHTCALVGDNGAVQCWGLGDSGQRGDGSFNTISTVPGPVVGITGAVGVATRGYHSCALLGDGTVWCWGRNSDGQLGNGTAGTQCPTTPPPPGSPPVLCSSTPVQSGITGAADVIAGGYHTCALFTDGTAQCWGRNDDGQLGDGTFTTSSTPVPVGGLTGAAAVTGGFYHACALLGDGTVQCWGRNAEGQLGDGSSLGKRAPTRVAGLSDARAVSGGYKHTCAVLGNGTVWCWGLNDDGQLGSGTTTSSTTPVQAVGINDAVAVSAGILHTCALLSNSTVKCWGAVAPGDGFGQLGNGARTGSSTPVTVTGTGVVWTSSNGAVATIDAGGRATGLGAGTATIAATDGSGVSASTTLTVTDRVTLSVVRTGIGTGSVSGPGISCGTDCSEPYDRGTSVTLTAAPGSGSTFTGWSGCDTVSGTTCTVTMSGARVVTATFDLQRFTLTINKAGLGSGTVTSSPPGINCGTDCSEPYPSGTVVTLTATPALLNVFTGWDGCDAVSDTTCTVTMSRARSVTASFLGVPF